MVSETAISPIFIVGTGRCGSTMISDILNLHPEILSLSEFLAYTGICALRPRRVSGIRMWRFLSEQQPRTRLMLAGDYEELTYPFGRPGARYTRETIPPILCSTLPHLTRSPDRLFDELEPFVTRQPTQSPADHYRSLFERLRTRFGCRVWAERSGASILFAPRLVREFPEARFIHVHRDGRETAISMSRHYLFRLLLANLTALRGYGLDPIAAIARSPLWGAASMYLEPVARRLVDQNRLPYDKLTLADFGAFWSAMIERAERVFRGLPADRVLQVGFERIQDEPAPEIRRLVRFIDPSLDDAAWLERASRIPRTGPGAFRRLDPVTAEALTHACLPGLRLLARHD